MSETQLQLLIDSFPKILLPGLTMTVPLTLISFAIGLLIALVTALIQAAKVPVLKQVARVYVWIIRGTPLLVQLFVVFYGLSYMGLMVGAFPAAVAVFALNTGAYCAEDIRAAIESIPGGQLEAGYCSGMTWWQTMRRIILPQAMKTAFPPLSNSLISLVKDTSLASNITIVEMFTATRKIAARTYEHFILYCEVAVIYLIFCSLLTLLQHYLEKKLSRKEA